MALNRDHLCIMNQKLMLNVMLKLKQPYNLCLMQNLRLHEWVDVCKSSWKRLTVFFTLGVFESELVVAGREPEAVYKV